MEYLIGVVLAAAVVTFAGLAGFDRDRAFYPTVLITIATYYILFAAIGASLGTVVVESMVAGVFLAVAAAGFKKSLWLVVGALAAHGVFDFSHHQFIDNPGVPAWWPGFCLAFDVVASGWLAALLAKRSRIARPT